MKLIAKFDIALIKIPSISNKCICLKISALLLGQLVKAWFACGCERAVNFLRRWYPCCGMTVV